MSSGAALVSSSRSRLIQELEYARRLGIAAFEQVLRSLDPADLDAVWDDYAPVLVKLIEAQQNAGRRSSLAYLSIIGLGAGLPYARARMPVEGVDRIGRLPSGMPVSALVNTVPMAVAHRMEMGMTQVEAWQKSRGYLLSAASAAAHQESRDVMTDVLKAEQVELEEPVDTGEFDGFVTSLEDLQRYVRVPSAGACQFCLMLSTKGPIFYRDSFSSTQASSRRFNGDGGARVHFNCKCTLLVVPNPSALKAALDGDAKSIETKVWKDTRQQNSEPIDLLEYVRRKALITKRAA